MSSKSISSLIYTDGRLRTSEVIFGALARNSYERHGGAGPFSDEAADGGKTTGGADARDIRIASGDNSSSFPLASTADAAAADGGAVAFATALLSSPISSAGLASDQAWNASTFECMNAMIRRMANTVANDSSVFRAKDVSLERSSFLTYVVKIGSVFFNCLQC